ncbi:hypothetical protein K227x_53280 [Rubripirellula lacrimiformis]|uniref:Uncharacterized protein n=1 Tax=Rubripirellula lacrimiformis TaxID=1930273 RepID=A0A517NIE4_9BACT|nr:hypothetical protein [Rubripirellula lacrimiformis]QDT06905.1 hypothetical protein K227x_53280 [Rubripirellula lacrimiformis]
MEASITTYLKAQSYGDRGYYREADDPTPDEIRQRCREIHRMKSAEYNRQDQVRQSRQRKIVSAIQRSGAINGRAASDLIGTSQATASKLLFELASVGTLVRISRSRYGLPDTEPTIATGPDLASPDAILRRFRDRARSPRFNRLPADLVA